MYCNTIFISGRLGGIPERKTINTQNGIEEYSEFSICTNNPWREKQGKDPIWHRVKVYGKFLVDKVTQLSVGDEVFVKGSSETFKSSDGQIKHLIVCGKYDGGSVEKVSSSSKNAMNRENKEFVHRDNNIKNNNIKNNNFNNNKELNKNKNFNKPSFTSVDDFEDTL